MTVTILVVDDEENARKHIGDYLDSEGYEVLTAANLEEAREHLEQENADIILLDVQLPDGYGPDLLDETVQFAVRPPIILITAHGDIDMAVEAMKNGAQDFLQKPIQFDRLELSIQRAKEIVDMRRELAHFREQQRGGLNFVVGKSSKMREQLSFAQRAAQASVSVLITGETGTGKEILARAIHQLSPRAGKPFMGINCAAIQSTMLEAELFGYEAGAFTGAQKRKHGLMEVADEGILFLDEISSLPVDMQAKLLRALEEQAFRRVGGTNLIKVDVQILAASNRDPKRLIEEGKFREDLYYRLKVVDLHIPPLRERKEDIPELVGLFMRANNQNMGLNIGDISERAMTALVNHDWPGNIRELRNAIERAMLFCDEPVIGITHLPSEFLDNSK
ncbi:MAG: sigma-54-dependent Fis family transcriptional regulator [Anaerolineales bacterium]|nr:sigma-54-dependent Fis family transcriptional regulator [Anaerolineales bacterium]